MAKKSGRLCIWDKGLFQRIVRLVFHGQQYRYIDVEKYVYPLIQAWPRSDLYVFIDTTWPVAFERSKGRPKKTQWTKEAYRNVHPIMRGIVDQLKEHSNVLHFDNNYKSEKDLLACND